MELDFNINEIPVIFSSDKTPNIYDCIAFVRLNCPSPWEKVILNSPETYLKDSLASVNIFYKTEVYSESDNIHSLLTSKKIYMVITKDMLISDDTDYGIIMLIKKFCSEYSISEVIVLLYFTVENDTDIEILKQIFNYINNYKCQNYIIKYPNILSKHIKYDLNTIDLLDSISSLKTKRAQNNCNFNDIVEIITFVKNEAKLNKNILTYSGIDGCTEQRILIPYFTLKYNLTPMFYQSFISWCEEYNYTYFYGRMSLYERILFVKNLPLAMRYSVKSDISIDCRLIGFRFPKILHIYNYETCNEVDIDIDLSTTSLIDYRTFFKNQSSVNIDNYNKSEDEDINRMLIDKFINMSKSENINIRNSVIALYNNLKYVIYTEGDFILDVILQADTIFPKIKSEIPEKKFGKLHSHPLFKNKVGSIKPVYDLEVPLFLSLFPNECKYLSYFESALRWCKILEDNIDEKGNLIDIFEHLPLETIRNEKQGRYFISSFGNPLNFCSNNKKDITLYLSEKVMKGRNFY